MNPTHAARALRLAGLSLLVTGQLSGQEPAPNPLLDISLGEAVVREFRASIRIPQGDAWYVPVYLCLRIGKADAPDSLLNRLSDIQPPMVAASECAARFTRPLRERIPSDVLLNFRRGSNDGVWLMTVDTLLAPRGPNTWTVRVGYEAAIQWAGGFECTVTRADTRWSVTHCWQYMISGLSAPPKHGATASSRLTDPVKLTGVGG